MKKMFITFASALLLSNVAIGAEQAATVATVSSLQGSGVVARGGNGMPLRSGMVLLEGDKVAVLENSSVKLSFADCAITYQQNTLLNISESAPCAQGAGFGVGAGDAAAVGGAGGGFAGLAASLGLAPGALLAITAALTTFGVMVSSDDNPGSP